jgi:transcriptional regulator with XRE-family HTH domain
MARYRRKSPKKLAEKLREVRMRLEMTQEEVAKHLGTDSGAISRFERGLREPSLLEILAYSYMSGVGVEVLIDDKRRLAKKRDKLSL